MEKINNIIESSIKAESWYSNLKNVAKDHLNTKIVEGKLKQNQHIKHRKGLIKSIHIVTVDETYNVYDRIHWVLGLMLKAYCKQKKLKSSLSTEDMNFVGDNLWHKYMDEELSGDEPSDYFLANKVLNDFVRMLDTI